MLIRKLTSASAFAKATADKPARQARHTFAARLRCGDVEKEKLINFLHEL